MTRCSIELFFISQGKQGQWEIMGGDVACKDHWYESVRYVSNLYNVLTNGFQCKVSRYQNAIFVCLMYSSNQNKMYPPKNKLFYIKIVFKVSNHNKEKTVTMWFLCKSKPQKESVKRYLTTQTELGFG